MSTTTTSNRGSDTEILYVSPVSTLLIGEMAPFGRPGQDGRKRRYKGSSDEQDETPVDDFITEDLRAGGPYLCDIPVNTLSVPDGHPLALFVKKDHQGFVDQVEKILQEYNVDHTGFNICGRQSKFDPENSPVPTLLVYANRHELNNSWVEACRALEKFLKNAGQTSVSVEIADKRINDHLHFSSVLPMDDIFLLWDKVLNMIWDQVRMKDINAVGCYRIGKSSNKDENPPTINIMVSRSSSRLWKPVQEQVIDILSYFNLIGVGIRVVKGEIRKGVNQEDAPLTSVTMKPSAQFGMSMGLSNSKVASVTFGGFIEIYRPGVGWRKYGLTCFHCVDPQNKSDVLPSQYHHKCARDGVKPGDIEASRQLLLDMPSLRDFTKQLKKLDGEINSMKQTTRFIEVQKAANNNEFIIPSTWKQHTNVLNDIAHLHQEKTNLEQHKASTGLSLGTVYAASGYQQRCLRNVSKQTPSNLDWALIDVHPSRMGDNTFGTYGTTPQWYRFRAWEQLANNPSAVPQVDGRVYKVGCSTQYTEGYYSGLKEAHIARVRSATGKMVTKMTLEHSINDVSGRRFSDLGDSGALVFDDYRMIVGMIFGGSNVDPISYMTLAEDIFDDIKSVTGATDVRVPQ